jgi:hypothetical protein
MRGLAGARSRFYLCDCDHAFRVQGFPPSMPVGAEPISYEKD